MTYVVFNCDDYHPLFLEVSISKGSEDLSGANALNCDKASNTMEKQKPTVFLQRLNSTNHLSCPYWSMDVTAGRRRRIWRGESRSLKTNATEECLAYHTGSIKQTNRGWQQVDILAGSQERSLSHCQPSSVASYNGSAMYVVTIRCRRSHYKEQWMNSRRRGRPRKSWKDNGQASRCCNCYASRMTEVDGQSSQRTHLSEHPNDA